MTLLAGLDRGGSRHAVRVIDATGGIVARCRARHDAAGLAGLMARPKRLGPPAELPVAIERPSGLPVDALVAAGHPVVPIHPNIVKACRPRYRAAAAGSDPGDAFMPADIPRTDGHRFRPLTPLGDEIRAPGALVRGRDDLVATRPGRANPPRSLLESLRPGAAAVFAAVDGPIAPAFVRRQPTPESAARLAGKRTAAFLAGHAYCGRRSPADLLARLRAAPAGLAGDAEADAKGGPAAALAATLERGVEQITNPSARIEHAVAAPPDGRIVMSFPRAGRICAARILAELGSRDRFRTEDQLAAAAGVSPVTHASGKSRGVVFRRACNHRLGRAVTCFADNAGHACDRARSVCDNAGRRGCRHQHAVRILARAWIRVLRKARQTGTAYDPQRHAAARLRAA